MGMTYIVLFPLTAQSAVSPSMVKAVKVTRVGALCVACVVRGSPLALYVALSSQYQIWQLIKLWLVSTARSGSGCV